MSDGRFWRASGGCMVCSWCTHPEPSASLPSSGVKTQAKFGRLQGVRLGSSVRRRTLPRCRSHQCGHIRCHWHPGSPHTLYKLPLIGICRTSLTVGSLRTAADCPVTNLTALNIRVIASEPADGAEHIPLREVIRYPRTVGRAGRSDDPAALPWHPSPQVRAS